ncbi:MAG: PD-(D/E)XK nuclease family protein, partial [Deltaproteobacteria bacterium]|nr:PD-(D/E)XK nuclease family protein [Deltaproteobacteria bacterium]
MRPSGHALTSAEYQALEAWKELLEGFSSLDDVLGRITREDSVRKICDMASSTLHQKEAGERPVEVQGILESSGMFFDKVWLMGCDEDALPPQPSPNPFIPLSLLQRHGVRLSTHERVSTFAKTALRRILKSAPSPLDKGGLRGVEASYPLSKDEKKLCLSPLLKGLGEPSHTPPLGGVSVKTALAANIDIEPRLVEARLEVSPMELKTMSGGTSILKDQSACPFRAFARYRLRASGLKSTEFGLRAYERGTIVHDALKWFWENVRDSAKLREIAEKGELAAYAQRAAAEALKDFSVAKDEDRQYIDLESKRVSEVVLEWLNFELERPDFSVREIEERKEVNVGGLSIFARIDRVDETAGGERVVIDYKTGKCSKDYWLPGRPKEP